MKRYEERNHLTKKILKYAKGQPELTFSPLSWGRVCWVTPLGENLIGLVGENQI